MKKLKWSFKFLYERNSGIGIIFPQCLDLSFPWQHLTNRFYLWDRLFFVSSQCCCIFLSILLQVVQVWILFWNLSVFLGYMRDRPRFLRQLGGKLGEEVIRRHPGCNTCVFCWQQKIKVLALEGCRVWLLGLHSSVTKILISVWISGCIPLLILLFLPTTFCQKINPFLLLIINSTKICNFISYATHAHVFFTGWEKLLSPTSPHLPKIWLQPTLCSLSPRITYILSQWMFTVC